MYKTEDQVRDLAGDTLFKNLESDTIEFGVGQVTTFNKLNPTKFKGILDKPDGWYLPPNINDVAVVLECKSSDKDLTNSKTNDEILKNIKILNKVYRRVVGILYNSVSCIVYKNEVIFKTESNLKNIDYYLHLFDEDNIDKQLIYTITKRINDSLHIDFGIKNLYHRMIFTACALVAKRFGASLFKGMDYPTFHTSIHSTLSKSLVNCRKQNQKLDLLLEVFAEIKMNSTENQDAIDNFIDNVSKISDCLNSKYWNGEDVMAIFFNEFSRYQKKPQNGQVFTPDHITSFMYRLIECSKDDFILDATCGSGSFLVKAMCNMINEAGGQYSSESDIIKNTHLYGIEFDREIFALACANMLIHKDGKTNLEQLDTRTESACEWIKSKPITKVLMNPPYESKYGCMPIVENVLNSVKACTDCAFILKDTQLEKASKKQIKRILSNHKLIKIIKLPEPLFFGVGVTTSIFVFKAGQPQNDQEIFGCYIEDDGLETVKNKGRQDIKHRWHDIEDYWIDSISKLRDTKYNTAQWIKPSEHLSYQMPEKPFEISEEDFKKTAMDYIFFKNGIDTKFFGEKLLNATLYGSEISSDENGVNIKIGGDSDD